MDEPPNPPPSFLHHTRSPGIFGVPLRQSITYANVAISLIDENGQSYIYGYVPIVVAKCGVYLKEKATGIEGIFRLSGSEKRIKELKNIFDSPDRYGKGLDWDGYTVHDAANVLRRYLNDLPEPVVPLDLYEKFREPLKGATKQAVGDAEGPQLIDNFDEQGAIIKYQQLITELPPLNRQLLLYILDLLAVFAAKSDENRMNSQNLAAIFQPGMLSHPDHAMAPEEYRLNQCVIIFLIENQDHFLIGMQGTATDEKTKQEIEKGETERRQPNKLKKKRIPGSVNPSAASSTTSLQGAQSAAPSPSVETSNPMENAPFTIPEHSPPPPSAPIAAEAQISESAIRDSQAPPHASLYPETNLKANKSPPASLHSSFNEGSDMDQVDEPASVSTAEASDSIKEKKRRWRLSRSRRDEAVPSPPGVTSPRLGLGSNDRAEMSATSIGSSSHRPRKSFTAEGTDIPSGPDAFSLDSLNQERDAQDSGRDEPKGPIGWIRNKYREAKENAEQRRNKSPPADTRQPGGLSAAILPSRGKSLDIKRDEPRSVPSQSIPQQPPVPQQPATTQQSTLQPQPQSAAQQQPVSQQQPSVPPAQTMTQQQQQQPTAPQQPAQQPAQTAQPQPQPTIQHQPPTPATSFPPTLPTTVEQPEENAR
ncbi:hypothetical protein ACHAQH_001775 [Verticillium albo-atrum]